MCSTCDGPHMAESLTTELSGSAVKEAILQTVVTEDLDHIPPDFGDQARFVICTVRAVARRTDTSGFTTFVYSDAPRCDGEPHSFQRILHMQDGHGVVNGLIILTGRDANNGVCKAVANVTLVGIMNELEALGLHTRSTVIWDSGARSATVYPEGTANDQVHIRFLVPQSESELTQDEVCEVLNAIYNDNLKNPSGHTAKLWSEGKLVKSAEDEIERHIKGQMALFFAGNARPIQVFSQTNTSAGRTDLTLLQTEPKGGPRIKGIVELKVLRGPERLDYEATTEGLRQGFFYRETAKVPFATLALYDVANPPSGDPAPLLKNQDSGLVAAVRVRRFPIYNSPQAWRNAGGPIAARQQQM